VKVNSKQVGAVKKDVLSVIRVDESEPVRVDEPVDFSLHL
jgi:hypothetical protein